MHYQVVILGHLSGTSLSPDGCITARGKAQTITKIQQLKDRLQFMIAIAALPGHLQKQIQFGRRWPGLWLHADTFRQASITSRIFKESLDMNILPGSECPPTSRYLRILIRQPV